MRNNTLFFALLVFALLSSCKNDPKATGAQAQNIDTLQVLAVPAEGAEMYVIVDGSIEWSGMHTLNKDGHQGTILVESGELLINKGQPVSGKFTIDMNTVSVSDIKDPGERRDLESHLKDADFFEVKAHPKAVFEFKEVLPSATTPSFNWVLNGALTMKGKTNPVVVPAKITLEGDMLKAETPSFSINRTQWGVNFQSGILGTAKDKMIDDSVPISIRLEAKKAVPAAQ
jgi:Uncharacterized conserved protein